MSDVRTDSPIATYARLVELAEELAAAHGADYDAGQSLLGMG